MRALRALLLAVVLGLSGGAALGQALVVDLAGHLVRVTTGFAGAELVIFGTTDDPRAEIVAVVRGPEAPVAVRHKERFLGIWYNSRAVTFDAVPGFYRVVSNRPVQEVVPAEVRRRQHLGLDEVLPPGGAARGAKRLTPEQVDAYRHAVVEGRKTSGLYAEDSNRRIAMVGGGLFRTSILLPKTAPLGTYQVQVFLVRDGAIRSVQSTPLIVSKDGINADIVTFAQDWRVAYGLLTVLLAAAVGWMAAVLLRRF